MTSLTEKKKSRPVSFRRLDLSDEMLAALEKAGYEAPTPIQAALLPPALDGLDVLGQARTGTGKTAAFAIPILEQLGPRREFPGPQALILVPTRELAVQVRDEVTKLAYGQKVHTVALYGGKPLREQIEKLKHGAQVVVGTPGRVIDHIQRKTLVLDDVWCVVLDEADRMLDIGFRPDIERILRRCPKDRQTLLLSATIPSTVERLARTYMIDPVKVDVSTTDVAVETIEQFYFTVDPHRKFDLLLRLLTREQPRQAIIFCRTKRGTDSVHQRLTKHLPHAECIHGDMNQSARDRVMARFRAGKTQYLVATDIVGRGIDVSSISHIVNYDIPEFCDDYVHRVGRTGRMGREGVAYTFVCPEQGPELTKIEQRINRVLVRDEIKGFETVQPPPEPTDGAEDSAVKPPPPPFSLSGRGKRHRRAL